MRVAPPPSELDPGQIFPKKVKNRRCIQIHSFQLAIAVAQKMPGTPNENTAHTMLTKQTLQI